MGLITEKVKRILAELPPGVTLAAAAKTRRPEEIEEAIFAGVGVIGQNYLQEAEAVRSLVRAPARWHFIGHLQTRKARKALELFDLIETLDSARLAGELQKRCLQDDRTVDVLIEVNSGREPQKAGVFPEKVRELLREISDCDRVRVRGLMTMGPLPGEAGDSRPYFSRTRELFRELAADPVPGAAMEILSMGMSDTYRTAVEEGANLVRIGTAIFGPRP